MRTSLLDRCAQWALDGIAQEFPHKPGSVWADSNEVLRPRDATPIFYGCFDWHSAVHSHWSLARLAGVDVERARCLEALERSFRPSAIDGEVRHLSRPQNRGFEFPYGLGWFLYLMAELRLYGEKPWCEWVERLRPLEAAVIQRFSERLDTLANPLDGGQHANTAFGLGLALDWADLVDPTLAARWRLRGAELFHKSFPHMGVEEPEGYDFLSPMLCRATLAQRLDSPVAPLVNSGILAEWRPARAPDPTDGKGVHLEGLNMSRAWMAAELLDSDLDGDSKERLAALVATHTSAAADALKIQDYAGSHWLGTFFVRMETRSADRTTS